VRSGVLVALLGWVLWAVASENLAGLHTLSIVRGDGVRVEFSVEVAADERERRIGLMGRKDLAARHGMLFDFGAPTIASMWMKNTPVSLDMLFLDADGVVVWLQPRTTPDSLALISAPHEVRYVLEINAGEAQSLGISSGDRLLLPP
jgi:uncharacterized protein